MTEVAAKVGQADKRVRVTTATVARPHHSRGAGGMDGWIWAEERA